MRIKSSTVDLTMAKATYPRDLRNARFSDSAQSMDTEAAGEVILT